MNEVKDKTLMDIGLDFSNDTRYTLVVTDMAGEPPKDTQDKDEKLDKAATALNNTSSGDYSRPVPPFQSPIQEYTFSHKSLIKPETSKFLVDCITVTDSIV